MADDDWLNDMGLEETQGDDEEDDWMNEGEPSGAGGDADDAADWMGGDTGGMDAEAMLAAAQPEEPKPAAAPKQAEDPTRAKHVQKEKMRAAEDERAADIAAQMAAGTPLDDPEAEKARIKRLQEQRELEILEDTLRLDDDDEDDDEDDSTAMTPSASSSGTAKPSGKAAAAQLPKNLPEWVAAMPIKGKGWADVGGLLIAKAEASKNKLDTGKLIRGFIRAAVTEEVLGTSEIADIRQMLTQAEANVSIAATAKAQGRAKKKKKAKLGRKGQQVSTAKTGYLKASADADMMGMSASEAVSAAAASSGAGNDDDDDDFM